MRRVAVVDGYSGGLHLTTEFLLQGIEVYHVQSCSKIPNVKKRHFKP